MTAPINVALLGLARRAEKNDPRTLMETFVNAGPLLTLLQSQDNQVLFGRRGTGKTHALTYLAESIRENEHDKAIFVDLRNIGSSGGLYADSAYSLSERGTRLLIDVLEVIQGQLVDIGLEGAYTSATEGHALPLLDKLADAISEVRVSGPIEREVTGQSENSSQVSMDVKAGKGALNVGASSSSTQKDSEGYRYKESGVATHTIRFGAISQLLPKITQSLGIRRLWVLLDEWSSLPLELQPLLADLLRRSIMNLPSVVVKIAAIEERSRFFVHGEHPGTGVGMEVGADIAADINLDDFMVFEQDETRASVFFGELLFKHVTAVMRDRGDDPAFRGIAIPSNRDDFVRAAFTQNSAFTELVRAAEAVPRDAINVAFLAAQQADSEKISVSIIRQAAQTWYNRDKQKDIAEHEKALALLHWIIDEVIKQKRAKAFMLEQGRPTQDPLIRLLYDARILHIIRKGIAHKDTPGRYNAYAIDYGCYVDLMTTQRAPLGLLPLDFGDVEGYAQRAADLDVPSEDFRSIRRGILKIEEFETVWLATHPEDHPAGSVEENREANV
ncbi:hypothetical protein ACIP9H_17240 [Streptomyces sp. NPDC088732]|uniref:ORC-CDC6 family AAA ATPase n=1 Tax=Streptomyces sp. NPDC088732 TaxID=3365879 RepID=UPI00380B31CD